MEKINSVVISLLCIFSFFTGINGDAILDSCDQTSFQCHNGGCIYKYEWCDGVTDCRDGSDEEKCHKSIWGPHCDRNVEFDCGNRCIPLDGLCDGFVSCPNSSDENYCTCEEFNEKVGEIDYISVQREGSITKKCWKVTLNENEYVELQAAVYFWNNECKFANITISPATEGNETQHSSVVICPNKHHRLQSLNITFYEDIIIHYGNKYYHRDLPVLNSIVIKYQKIDTMCLESVKFRCDMQSCISPHKVCDGKADCENGLDERNCDYGALSASYSKPYRTRARQWMENQNWKENTQKAVVALHLSHDVYSNISVKQQELIVKQLELDIATYLLRSKTDKISVTELSAYINALMVICHDPRNFYGFDLISLLKEELQKLQNYTPPLPYLTLCCAKETIPEEDVNRLSTVLESSFNRGFILEIQALTILALTCITDGNQHMNLKENISMALNNLKKQQVEDKSFGNDYTTALVVQAMIANDKGNKKDEILTSAIEFLRKRQEEDGSFGDFLTTYLVLPILNYKSLVHVGKANCTAKVRRSNDDMVFDINSRLGGKRPLKYSVIIGDEKDQIHPVILRIPENITILELMVLASDIDPKYEFKTHQIQKKMYIYEISNIINDPENNKFWFIYQNAGNDTRLIPVQSPDEVSVYEKDHIIMWYKTLDSI